jgi:glyoxylase-like metal-dependent hydrolase (beta-lactamase superfamily II)
MTGSGTNTYVVGRGESGVAVIDPGPSDRDHLARVAAAVRTRGRPAMVLLTHHHVDHAEAAVEMARQLEVRLAAIPHRQGPRPDLALGGDERLRFGGATLRVIATPGHCRDHACFQWAETAAVFTGDLIAGEGYIVVSPPDGDMSAYLASLRRLGRLRPSALLPGHGPVVADPSRYIGGYIEHRLERERKVLAALDPVSWRGTLRLLPRAYADTPVPLWPVARRSLLAHLHKLVAEGRAEARGGRYRRTR